MKLLFLFLAVLGGFGIAQANECRIHGENYIAHRLKNSETVLDVESMEVCYNLAILKAMEKHEARGYKGELQEIKWVWTYNDGYFNDSGGAVNFRTPIYYKQPGTGDRFVTKKDLQEARERAENQFE
jgi:hypothetical protein